ncbi:plasma membrane calcium-transporting ATPase 3-like protein [Corchorus olitorius]|uniref:Plasma membrane calcium-transporting ATPase 3-like protein n=1 Tax=Corchorus olitorius TaxID=93759 RepID=A0A1R3G3T7_9ROSI|nr:plasma membrane calcium-transporting ATPase 3-like protein [Corchorus olitorius]
MDASGNSKPEFFEGYEIDGEGLRGKCMALQQKNKYNLPSDEIELAKQREGVDDDKGVI